MTAVLDIAIFVFAVFAALLFGCPAGWCLLTALGAAVIFAVSVFILKNSRAVRAAAAVLSLGLLVLCLMIPSAASDYGHRDYAALTDEYISDLDKGEGKQAEKIRKEIVKKYGETDDVIYSEALKACGQGDLDTAEELASRLSSKKSADYFLLRETIVASRYAESEALPDRLLEVYKEAADQDPHFVYMNKQAGILYFCRGDYERANYYLLNAVTYDEGDADPEALMYLGGALTELGFNQKALNILEMARCSDPSDEIMANILWYAEKAGAKEVQANETDQT
ncbi:MAG: hypothetical protein IKH78_03425 [Ruminococcus sp.]|nr:hypothetical protein [Ruminococcus sp.]MBR6967562.1 hypothetical protein [Ruminococcus sp.]